MAYKHISYDLRIKLEALFDVKTSKAKIAHILGINLATVYRELKRGMYLRTISDFAVEWRYSADIAQKDAVYKATAKGAPLKIGNDYKFVEYIENKILSGWSPDVIIGDLKARGVSFKTSICTKTLYNYIDSGLFLNISNKDLLEKSKRKTNAYNPIRRIRKTNVLCRSIEERPTNIEERKDLGHWEMDTVVGKSKGKSTSLLVFTERMTRHEFIMKIPSRTQSAVKKALDKLERITPNFSDIFKTITCDNGSEFGQEIIENSCFNSLSKRTVCYFCHPFSSFERGSNENQNKLIRRFVPKGKRISNYTHAEINNIQNWINNYPRKILGYRSSAYMYNLSKSTK